MDKPVNHNNHLSKLRERIDLIDLNLIELIAERQKLTDEVGQFKLSQNIQTRDLEREKDLILKKITLAESFGLSANFIHRIFDLLIEQSVKRQYQMRVPPTGELSPRVAFLGERGSYSHQALVSYFECTTVEPVPVAYKSFPSIVEAVINQETELAILPIENTTSGSILEVYDLLQESKLLIIGEEIIPIEHCIVSLSPVTKLSDIKTLVGHPQALTQCSNFNAINEHIKLEYCSSSADALELILNKGDEEVCAIANEFAAELYNLSVIKKQVSNAEQNFTRFIILSKNAAQIPDSVPCKTSLVLSTQQSPGALAEALNAFKTHHIPLTKIQSRPIIDKPWEELFYIDLEGHLESLSVKKAVEDCQSHCQFLKILGCYPNSKLEKAEIYR
ncbi:MAG: prephenate dehydratase [Gammaproteobacteria bacterium]|nr:prephenate dehydratase [Gammaproteobacteria bacterium]